MLKLNTAIACNFSELDTSDIPENSHNKPAHICIKSLDFRVCKDY